MFIECERLFDGETFYDNARITVTDGRIERVETEVDLSGSPAEGALRCRFAMPGLIDSHVSVLGYHEGPPEGRPFEPHSIFLQLLLYAGVTAVRDMGNTWEAIGYARHVSEAEAGVHIFASGPLLDDLPLTWAFSRIVQSADDAEREIRQLAGEGVDWISVFKNVYPDVVFAIARAARDHGLPVGIRPGRTTALEAIRAEVRSLESLADMIDPSWIPEGKRTEGLRPDERIRLWTRVDPGSKPVKDFIKRVVEKEIYVCPALLSNRRRALFDEAINEPHLDYMIPVMPYHRHLINMRNPFGYIIGKKFLSRYLPVPSLDKTAQKEVNEGLRRMREMLLLMHEQGVKLVVGTESPTQSIVPGLSMVSEMRQWVLSGIPVRDVLSAATARAADLLGTSEHGRVRSGAWADLILLDQEPDEHLNALFTKEMRVVCRGRLVDRERIREMISEKIKQISQIQG